MPSATCQRFNHPQMCKTTCEADIAAKAPYFASILKKTLCVVDYSLAALVGSFGIAIALMTVERGVWLDEFITIAWTTPGTSPREFLRLMITRDLHPILHYGMVYLLQAAGVTDIALLRSINL